MVVGEGDGERKRQPAQILDGGSDWCGDHLLSIKYI